MANLSCSLAPAGLTAQPVEILHRICSLLTKPDIKSLRLVSPVLSDIGSSYVFRHLLVFMSDESFAMLRSVASHPSLAKLVRALTFITEAHRCGEPVALEEFIDSFSRWSCLPKWVREYEVAKAEAAEREALIAEAETFDGERDGVDTDVEHMNSEAEVLGIRTEDSDTHTVSSYHDRFAAHNEVEARHAKTELPEAARVVQRPDPPVQWVAYANLAREQSNIITAAEDFNLLATSIPRLPNLEQVHISHKSYSAFGSHGVAGPWEKLASLRVRMPHRTTHTPQSTRAFRGFLTGQQLLSNSRLSILRVDDVDWSIFNFVNPPASDREGIPLAFVSTPQASCANLTTIYLRVGTGESLSAYDCYGSEAAPCRAALDKGYLSRFLAGLGGLRSLSVIFKYKYLPGYERDALDRIRMIEYPASLRHIIPPGHVWPHLKTLMLGNVDCAGPDLCAALSSHSGSLIHLGLQGLRLNSLPWAALIRHAKKSLLSLVDVCIVGASYGSRLPDLGDPEGWYFCLDTPNSWDRFFTSVTAYLLKDGLELPFEERRMHFDYGREPDHDRIWADFGLVVPISESEEYKKDRQAQSAYEDEFNSDDGEGNYSLSRRPAMNSTEPRYPPWEPDEYEYDSEDGCQY